MIKDIIIALDKMYPDAKCELYYTKDYELLLATIMSAQTTDKNVNKVTKILFDKYDIFSLAEASINDIEKIIMPVGTFKKKSYFIKEVAKSLVEHYDGKVPNDRKYLESLPGVGRKTCNVVLSNLYDVPCIAVDTHVFRVSKRLGLASKNDDVFNVEKKLMKKFPKDKWTKLHHQLVLFGRYICKAKNPDCYNCELYNLCKSKEKKRKDI